MKSIYRRLGNYIDIADKRNRNLEIENLIGLSIQKKFILSISNTIGTDMSTYRIINTNQFAYCPVTSRNGEKITIALYQGDKTAMVSQAYDVFEITNDRELLPEYLMMWFRRPEFDRYARFMSHGSVREMFSWEDMCEVKLPIPHLDKQKEIVKEYNTILNRISLNNQFIQKLEETAQAIYKRWFVEFEFPDENGKPYKSSGGEMEYNEELGKEIPKGWRVSQIENEFDLTIGRTPPRIEEEWFSKSKNNSVDWISIKDIVSNGSYIFGTNESLTTEAINKFSIPMIPENTTILSFKMTVGKVAITTKEMLSNEAIAHFRITDKTILTSEFIYCFFDAFKFNALGTTSSIVDSINTKIIKQIKIVIPSIEILNHFNKLVKKIFQSRRNIEYQTKLLEKMNSLLLSNIATIDN